MHLTKHNILLDNSNGDSAEDTKQPLDLDFASTPNISVGFRLASYKQGKLWPKLVLNLL